MNSSFFSTFGNTRTFWIYPQMDIVVSGKLARRTGKMLRIGFKSRGFVLCLWVPVVGLAISFINLIALVSRALFRHK